MRKAIPIALVFVACVVLGQDQRSGWTDKNNGQNYAAYMLKTTYYERGYMSADVKIRQSVEGDIFVVNPGPVFHFQNVNVIGLPEALVRQFMKDAPKSGEAYSADRVNEWLAQQEKWLAKMGVVRNLPRQETRMDHEAASATVTVSF